MTYQDLKEELRMNDFTNDPWGAAINMQFDIAEELYFNRSEIPDHWQFSPGAGSEASTNAYANVETEELIKFGNLLHRVVRATDHAGKSY